MEKVITQEKWKEFANNKLLALIQKEFLKILKQNNMKDLIKQQIENMGWKKVEDRDMSENYGHLYKRGSSELKYWEVHPRINISKNGRIYFESGILDEKDLLKLLEGLEFVEGQIGEVNPKL